MNLTETMYDAVADVSADLTALAAGSRRRGLALRRRRRALASVGVAAAAVVVAGTGYAVWPSGDTLTDPAWASTSLSGETAPITGRGTAAALLAAVEQVADGSFSGFAGQELAEEGHGLVIFTPAGQVAGGAVEVNVQPIDRAVEICKTVPGGGPADCSRSALDCTDSFYLNCHVETLPDGDRLRTYRDFASTSGTADDRRVAELVSESRGLRIVAQATNMDAAEKPLRADAVLTVDQLAEIVELPWWALRLPVEYVSAGASLPAYDDLGGAIPGPTPTFG